MKTATSIIMTLTILLIWSGLLYKAESDYHQSCLEDNRVLQLRYEDEHYKAIAWDSATAKDERMQSHIKMVIDNATKTKSK